MDVLHLEQEVVVVCYEDALQFLDEVVLNVGVELDVVLFLLGRVIRRLGLFHRHEYARTEVSTDDLPDLGERKAFGGQLELGDSDLVSVAEDVDAVESLIQFEGDHVRLLLLHSVVLSDHD